MKIINDLLIGEVGDWEAQQSALAEKVEITSIAAPETVCGLDVAYRDDFAVAAAVVLERNQSGFETIDSEVVLIEELQPYKPGRFALREADALVAVLQKLNTFPDVLVVDAHGTAHPRRFGLACLVGYIFDHPTIGCAKNLLFGEHEPPATPRGSTSDIIAEEATIGVSLRTVDNVKPVFVSIGHKLDLESAVATILRFSRDVRIPEPIRAAHQLAEATASHHQTD